MSAQVHLGLTFYGGISLAVFEAGIAYELVRAVQFSRTEDKPDGVPEIHVDVITGTSAGGLAAVQMAAALAGTNTEAVLAEMLKIWANDADIRKLLPTAAFDQQGLLDNQRLRECAEDVLKLAAEEGGEQRLEDDLDAYLTLTNLSGLREPVALTDDPGAPVFPTTRHVEYEGFRFDDVTDPAQRQRFVDAAVITAGFPVAFPPALKASTEIDEGKPEPERTRFVYVDGGVMDNRPLGRALDAIAEKPAPQRLFFFIDPNETWVPPSYGAGDAADRRIDPWGVYSKIGPVARSDSIFNDLARVRGMYDDLAILDPLSRQAFESPAWRADLLRAYPQVVQRRFNPEAWGLWQMVEKAVGPEVQAAWDRVGRQERFALRARLHEFVDHMVDTTDLTEARAAQIKFAIDTAPGWKGYYEALRGLRETDKRFRQLKYRLWHDHFRHGPRPGTQLSEELQGLVREAFEALDAAAERLRGEREGLARQLLEAADLQGLDLAAATHCQGEIRACFRAYAQAMQVLESLAGIRRTPNLSVRRITPFDIYAEGTDLASVRPLAGGALGSFGGFFDKSWRINDFLVGRLAMRVQLRRHGLIPEGAAFDRYLAWSNGRDAGVIDRLKADPSERDRAAESPECEALRRLATLEFPAGGFASDADKPAPLLAADAMDPGALPGSRVGPIVRQLLDSVRRILRMNQDRPFYRVLRNLLSPLLGVVGGLLLITERSFGLRVPDAGDSTQTFIKRFIWVIGWLAIAAFVLILYMLSR
ncbi:DUF3376 domain-containing protein [Thiococcus pfennigii]|uniref:DUF3376 domain-containing protein n=1 Tax=Thiococcus pfennigii TaxID=1057 RepID=UPI00190351EC|nr:DUF3376 domain-containing protein [Thiococcus pfennigii]MBK1701634.1 hypothetical protein [Thiococcus pfennigii]